MSLFVCLAWRAVHAYEYFWNSMKRQSRILSKWEYFLLSSLKNFYRTYQGITLWRSTRLIKRSLPQPFVASSKPPTYQRKFHNRCGVNSLHRSWVTSSIEHVTELLSLSKTCLNPSIQFSATIPDFRCSRDEDHIILCSCWFLNYLSLCSC